MLLTDRTDWTGDAGGEEGHQQDLIMRKNKFLMNNKETGDKTGETRGDERLSLAPAGYDNNICYQVVIRSNNANVLIKPPTSQLLPTLVANIGSFSAGLAVGFPALLLRQLEHQQEPLSANTTVQISLNMTHRLAGLEEESFRITEEQTNLAGGSALTWLSVCDCFQY